MPESLIIHLRDGASPQWMVCNDDGHVIVNAVSGDLGADRDCLPGRTVLHRVVQQIEQNLMERVGVDVDDDPGLEPCLERHAPRAREWAEELDDFVNLVIEVDGFAFHSSRWSFESDRRRDAKLVAQGFRVMRVTWRQIAEEPEVVLVSVTRALLAGDVATL
jgi:hypothetical protein